MKIKAGFFQSFYSSLLFPQKLTGSDTGNLLEKPREMVGELEAQHAGSLADVVSLHQQALTYINNIGVDVVDGCCACRPTKKVAEVVG